MNTIILRNDDVLENETYGNCDFDTLIKVEGDNVVIDNLLIYSPKNDFACIIEVNGNNCHIKNCRIQDVSGKGAIILLNSDECIIENCLFYSGLKISSNENIVVNGIKNIIYNNRFENWDRNVDMITVENDNNLIVNNEIVNCEGCLMVLGNNNIIAYNFIDGKAKKKALGIYTDKKNTIIGNVLVNIEGVEKVNSDKPKEFALTKIEDMIKAILDFSKQEEPVEEKEESVEEDIVSEKVRYVDIDKFMKKLTLKISVLARVKHFEALTKKMDENLKEYKILMNELKEIMK